MHPDDERDAMDVHRLLRALDHEPPDVTADDVVLRHRRRSRGPGPWGRVAAGIAAALLAVSGAYAVPHSPLPGWLTSARAALGGRDTGDGRPQEAAVPRDAAGVALDPATPVTILLRDGGAGAWARVVVTDGGEVVVRSRPGAGTFTSEPTRLVVDMLSPDTFHILVPRRSARVEVLAGGRSLFLLSGGRVTAARPPDGEETYLLPLGADPG